jgi:hypothetical protein
MALVRAGLFIGKITGQASVHDPGFYGNSTVSSRCFPVTSAPKYETERKSCHGAVMLAAVVEQADRPTT